MKKAFFDIIDQNQDSTLQNEIALSCDEILKKLSAYNKPFYDI